MAAMAQVALPRSQARIRIIMKPVFLLIAVVAAAAAPHSVWDGVYTSAQAGRGQKVYATECARCHGDVLEGVDDSPPLVGQAFLKKWRHKSVARLVDLTRRTMPSDGPGDLTRQQCTDMIAYILSVNGFPAGTVDLASEVEPQREIMIEPPKEPASAPPEPEPHSGEIKARASN